MILTCPHCSTRYFVWRQSLKPPQYLVRCTSCGEVWPVTPHDDTPLPLTQVLSPGQESPDSHRQMNLSASLKTPASPEIAFRSRLEAQKKRRWQLLGWGLLSFLILGITGFILTSYVQRFELVRHHPRLARVFDGFGVEANVYGLDFQNIIVDHTRGREGDNVLVRGSIVNIAQKVRRVPPLRARMLNDEGMELASTEALLDLDELAPGEKVRFRAAFMSVPDEAEEVILDFIAPVFPESTPSRQDRNVVTEDRKQEEKNGPEGGIMKGTDKEKKIRTGTDKQEEKNMHEKTQMGFKGKSVNTPKKRHKRAKFSSSH